MSKIFVNLLRYCILIVISHDLLVCISQNIRDLSAFLWLTAVCISPCNSQKFCACPIWVWLWKWLKTSELFMRKHDNKEAWVMLQYNIETWFNFRITCIFSGAKVQRWQARLNWNSPLLQHWAQLACSRPYISQVMSRKKLNYYSNALKNVWGLY